MSQVFSESIKLPSYKRKYCSIKLTNNFRSKHVNKLRNTFKDWVYEATKQFPLSCKYYKTMFHNALVNRESSGFNLFQPNVWETIFLDQMVFLYKAQRIDIVRNKGVSAGQIPFLGGWSRNFFIRDSIAREKFCPPIQIFSPWGNTDKKGRRAEYLIITKERLVLGSAPYAPHECFFHQGEKHTI